VTIPLRIPLPRALDPVGIDRRVLFVGGFGHVPNVDAAMRLCELFPNVLERVPDAQLEIVGANPPPRLAAFASERISLAGGVGDVEPYIDRAAVVAAPLRLGGGTRIKVLEALGHGKAVVATPLAVEGLDVRHERELLLAETDAAFSDAVARLLVDREERRHLARAARRWAEQELNLEHSAIAYDALYRDLVSDGVP
jgi:glycosyltransferase involved in cell wall biosynthesis